jgi:hypothetical protein
MFHLFLKRLRRSLDRIQIFWQKLIVLGKAFDRGDKRTRRLRVRVLALRENPRRVRERVSTLQEKARRGRVLDTVLRDTPLPRTSTRSLDTGLMDRTLNTEH